MRAPAAPDRAASRWRPRARPAQAAALSAVLVLAACGGGTEQTRAAAASRAPSSSAAPGAPTSAAAPAAPTSARSSRPAATGTVTVFAAASLTGAFEQIADDLEAEQPGLRVTLNLAGSPALAAQIVSGAPADVYAAASPATMQTVVDADAARSPQVFARNRLRIAVPAGNPAKVAGLADFADEDLRIALCAPQVPCGAAAQRVFEAAGVRPAPDTLEQDVKATLSKVVLGEVDAALVYRTDVLAAGDEVEGIDVPEADRAVNDYLIAPLAEPPNAAGAQAFVAHVLSDEGQRVLADAGFDRP